MSKENIENIWNHSIRLPSGNVLAFFFNLNTNLLVVDLVHKTGAGGHELVRMTLDEEKLLAHLTKLPDAPTPKRKPGMSDKMKALPVVRRSELPVKFEVAPAGLNYFAVGAYTWGRGPTAVQAMSQARSNGSPGWYILHLVNRDAEVDQVDGTLLYNGKIPGVKPAICRVRMS